MTVSFDNSVSDEKWQDIANGARHSDHPEIPSEVQDVDVSI